ncbi:MAG: response regulator [Synergistaceae bacterium]|jgi:PAS domain S-box-containing protein|nr:response regulator [Synergistaceae bacterium]
MSRYEHLLDAIFDSSPDGILALSEAEEKVYVSPSYALLFPGWEKLRYDDPLDSVRDHYSKYVANLDDLMEMVAGVRRTRELREGRIRLFDGRVIHVSGKVIRHPDGGATDLWVYRDITQQCLQDEHLQLRLQIVTAVLDASNDAIFTLVEGLETPLTNAKYSSIFPGWEKSLRFGQPLEELEDFFSRHLVDWEAHIALVAKVRETGREYQTVHRHKDGRIIHVSGKMVDAGLARHGKLEIYTLKDITEKVLSRQKMHAMQLTVDNLSEPVVWFDPEGKITYVNKASCAALGYDAPGEIVGNTVRSIDGTRRPDDVSDIWSAVLAARPADAHVKFDRKTLAKKDGTLLPCTILLDRITQGGESFWAMCFHDLSEQIQRIEAERAAEAKSEFLARMSHEIRTPMNVIIGLSEMARRDYGTPKGLEYIAEINNAGKNLIAIINDILDFSKIESGRLEIVSSPYETASLLYDVLVLTRVKLSETPLELILDISTELPSVMEGDVGRIRQVLLNLLSNAVKYTKKGFISFSASGEAVSGDTVRLTFAVEDSGVGIKEDDIPKLFGKFSRIDEKRHIDIEGAGLGLIISRNLCRAMGGDITVRSEYGKGSVFTATLTQTAADWRPMGDISAVSVSRSEKQCVTFTAPEADVLIVDDFHSNLLVAKGLLAPYKMRVTTCQSGHEAVELIRRRPFDLVLMDHMMPEMDGIEATRAVRGMSAEYCRTMPVVALTANAVSGMREMFLENGFNDFLAKPIEMNKLDAVLKKWIPAEKHRGAPEEAGKAAAHSETAPLEIEGVDTAAGITRTGGSRRRYLELLALFRQDAEDGSALLAREPDAASLSSLTTLVHGLKSALAIIGANDLSQTAALLEKSARQSDMSAIRENLTSFRERLAALTERIAEIAGPVSEEGENLNETEEVGYADGTNGKNSRVMIVDDSVVSLKIAANILSEFYDVSAAPSAAKMFDLLKRNKPDIILLDVNMPEMDGYEAIKILKTDPDTRDIPVIFLTGMDSPRDELKGLSLGAVDYISKPFIPQLLRKKMELYVTVKAQKRLLENQAQELEALREELERFKRSDH